MDNEDKRSIIPGGIIAAVVPAVALIYWIGIGGTLVVAAIGCIAAVIAARILTGATEKAYHDLEGSQQLEGIMDSSQLDDPQELEPAIYERSQYAGKIVIAVALVFALATAGCVQLATHGKGIHFYLGSFSFPSFARDASTSSVASTDDSTDATTEEYDDYSYTTDQDWQDTTSDTSTDQSQGQQDISGTTDGQTSAEQEEVISEIESIAEDAITEDQTQEGQATDQTADSTTSDAAAATDATSADAATAADAATQDQAASGDTAAGA